MRSEISVQIQSKAMHRINIGSVRRKKIKSGSNRVHGPRLGHEALSHFFGYIAQACLRIKD
jgi:hypothetical protein